MNTVVFSILRLCPPVPLCGGSSRYQLAAIRPWGDTSENSPCHGPQAWEGLRATAGVSLLGSLGAVARRRQPGLHQRARARRRRRTLLRPAASLRTRSRGIAPPLGGGNPTVLAACKTLGIPSKHYTRRGRACAVA